MDTENGSGYIFWVMGTGRDGSIISVRHGIEGVNVHGYQLGWCEHLGRGLRGPWFGPLPHLLNLETPSTAVKK
jgi:hypothetical protein